MEKSSNEINGTFLGYPKCCIRAFGDVAVPVVFRVPVIRKHIFNRYVPCGACATKLELGIMTKSELINQINTNRKCSVPFKEVHSIEEDTTINDELWQLMSE